MCVGRTTQEQLSRRINRRIVSYGTIYTTLKMRKKTSKNVKLIMPRYLGWAKGLYPVPIIYTVKRWARKSPLPILRLVQLFLSMSLYQVVIYKVRENIGNRAIGPVSRLSVAKLSNPTTRLF